MKRAKIAELRNGLSRYLDHVRAGGSVIVYDRDTPIAEIVPIAKTKRKKENDEDRLARLERKGLIIRGKGSSAEWLKHWKPVKVPGAGSLVDAILEERESGW
jgi:prevent-host-death family protein